MLRAGERIGPLKIERPLGVGGMGEVYLARDERLERHVAVKLLPEGRSVDPNARGRMLREARAASALKHPSIVTVHDVGEHEGRAYIVMEYVDGETFDALVERRGRLAPGEAVDLVAQAADAVSAAHAAGVLHRDIKSANLMIDGAGLVKVLDFGLSKRNPMATPTPVPGTLRKVDSEAPTVAPEYEDTDVGQAVTAPPKGDDDTLAVGPRAAGTAPDAATRPPDEPHTVHGARMGTPGWAPPELIDGRPADVRSDVFSLGCVLYHLLAGAPPFGGASWSAIREQIVRGPTPPSAHAPGVPAALDRVVLSALAADPTLRPATATALVAEARGALSRPRPRRTALWLALGIAGGAAAIAAAVAITLATRPAASRPAPAVAAPRDAGVRVPPPPPSRLTSLGGCAYSPTFLDDDTLVFDLTRDNAVDLYRLRLGDRDPVRLTSDPEWEWRASPGASSHEVVFLRQGDASSGTDVLDLATGARRALAGEAAAATYARDSYFYAPVEGGKLRRIRGDHDDAFAALPAGRLVDTLVPSPDGARLAMVLLAETILPTLCVVEVDGGEVRCLKTSLTSARPAFGADGRHLYVERAGGIARVGIDDDRAQPVLPSVVAGGGIAVSPSGRALVYSDCRGRSLLVSTLDDATRPVVDEPSAVQPAFGPGGVLAYVRFSEASQQIVLREPSGLSRELLSGATVHFSDLAFSPDGEHLAFVYGDPAMPGIYLASTRSSSQPNRLTQDNTDTGPVFAGDAIVFTRRDADGTPRLMRVGLDGTGEAPVGTRARITVAGVPDGRVLVTSPARDFLYWWSPTTGRETPGPKLPPGGAPIDVSISPDGRWLGIVDGPSGQSIWRIHLGGDERAEPAGRLRTDQSSVAGAIDDRGHPLVAANVWLGELWLAPAAEGAPW